MALWSMVPVPVSFWCAFGCAHQARSKTRAGRPAGDLGTIFLYQGLAGGVAADPEGGIATGAGGTTLRAVPSPVGTVPGLALVDWGPDTPAVAKPLERPFTAPTFWPAKVDGTEAVLLDIWAVAAVAVKPIKTSDRASNLMGISFCWKFISLLSGCAPDRPLGYTCPLPALTFVQRS